MSGRRRQLYTAGALATVAIAVAGCGSTSDDARHTALSALATPLAAGPASDSGCFERPRALRRPDRKPAPAGRAATACRHAARQLHGADPPSRPAHRRRRSEHAALRVPEPVDGPASRASRSTSCTRSPGRSSATTPRSSCRALTTAQRLPAVAVRRCGHRGRRGDDQVRPPAPGERSRPSTTTPRSGCSSPPARPHARLADLGGRRVCATATLDQLDAIERDPAKSIPFPSPSAPTASSRCRRGVSRDLEPTTRSSWASRPRIRKRRSSGRA